jgi:hypothetical protein
MGAVKKAAPILEQAAALRVVGQDPPAAAVLHTALDRGLPLTVEGDLDPRALDDYAQVDPALTIAPGKLPPAKSLPAGMGYAGLSPVARHHYLEWLKQPNSVAAPPAFRHLYVANLEVRLLEGGAAAARARAALDALLHAAVWAGSDLPARALLLGAWAAQDGAEIERLIAALAPGDAPRPPDAAHAGLVDVALGWLALLGLPLSAVTATAAARAWRLPQADLSPAAVRLRVGSLAATLGAEPLAHALAQAGEEARPPRPWRCAHRDLRVALPQPRLRRTLAPLLEEMFAAADFAPEQSPGPATAGADEATDAGERAGESAERDGWSLVLEFGHSRSEYFDIVLQAVQRLPGYAALLDEHRRMIYRVTFRRSEIRRFWRIWDYVQTWAGTRVYVNGKELDRWQVWPYSQYLR